MNSQRLGIFEIRKAVPLLPKIEIGEYEPNLSITFRFLVDVEPMELYDPIRSNRLRVDDLGAFRQIFFVDELNQTNRFLLVLEQTALSVIDRNL